MKKDRYQKAFRSFCRLRKAEIQAARDMVCFFFLVMGCADDSSTHIVRSLKRRMHSRERITLPDSEISSRYPDLGGLISLLGLS
jgi:hypothetical protein